MEAKLMVTSSQMGGVQALRAVQIPVSLCLDAAKALDPLLEGDE